MGDAPIPSYALSVGKDTKLLSILQIADVKRRKQGDALQTAAFQPHGGISLFTRISLLMCRGKMVCGR